LTFITKPAPFYIGRVLFIPDYSGKERAMRNRVFWGLILGVLTTGSGYGCGDSSNGSDVKKFM